MHCLRCEKTKRSVSRCQTSDGPPTVPSRIAGVPPQLQRCYFEQYYFGNPGPAPQPECESCAIRVPGTATAVDFRWSRRLRFQCGVSKDLVSPVCSLPYLIEMFLTRSKQLRVETTGGQHTRLLLILQHDSRRSEASSHNKTSSRSLLKERLVPTSWCLFSILFLVLLLFSFFFSVNIFYSDQKFF